MELSNNIAHTTESTNFSGKGFSLGFAFPEIDFALKGLPGDDPSDLQIEGLDHDAPVSYLGGTAIEDDAAEMGTDGDDFGDDTGDAAEIAEAANEATGYIGLTGFDPERASGLSGEIGEELVALAQELARELGADTNPAEFLAELRRRQVELSEEDREVLTRSRRLGALADPKREAGAVCRLADHGEAHLRHVEGELLLVPEGADEAAVAEAANRSREAREGKAARLAREAVVSEVLAAVADAPASLRALTSNLAMSVEESKDLLRGFARAGLLACRKVGDTVVLGAPGTSRQAFSRAATLARAVESQSYANVKESARRARERGSKAFAAPMVPFGGTPVSPAEQPKVLELERAKTAARDSGRTEARVEYPGWWDCEVYAGPGGVHVVPIRRREADVFGGSQGAFHCWPVEQTTVIHDPEGFFNAQLEEERTAAASSRRRAAHTGATSTGRAADRADELPEAERESGPDQRGASAPREYADATRRDAVLATATGRDLNPSRDARQREAAQRRVNRAVARGEQTPSERAWRTALAIHLPTVEDASDRLELLLQTKGRQEWAVLQAGSANPAELKSAARQLKDAGRLTMSREDGDLYIEAAAKLEGKARAEFERALLRLMVMGRVPVPKGTRLARRVAAHKGLLARESRAKARAKGPAA